MRSLSIARVRLMSNLMKSGSTLRMFPFRSRATSCDCGSIVSLMVTTHMKHKAQWNKYWEEYYARWYAQYYRR